MTLNSAIIICSALIFAVCASAFIIRSVRSYNFRNKIALPHGFSEGIMTGASYPALITAMSLLFIQLASFIAFKSPSETICALRAGCYLLTALIFFVLFMKTPALLAYWFGQNGLWEHSGRKGKISYSDIYNAQLSKKLRLPIINNQQLCKFTFYVKNKNSFFHPKKYICKMTAYEISALSRQVEFTEAPVNTEIKRVRISRRLIPVMLLAICIVSIAQFCVSGIFNDVRYADHNENGENEIVTFSAPSDIAFDGGKLFVYFDSLKAANVYSENGEFLYSVYQYENLSGSSDKHGGKEYRAGSRGVWYTDENGEKVFIVKYPAVNTVLNSDILWLINAFLIAFTIALRFTSDEYKRPVSVSVKSDEAKDDVSDSSGSFSDFSDETAAS
ncbi:MAG: hypothetical protein IJV70_04520 [Clostridia bacterium]|nr:hypothetical protein [Clostridia bacterium]